MMIRLAAMGAFLLVAGCQPSPDQADVNSVNEAAPEVAERNSFDAGSEGELETEMEALPPSTEALRFVGLWAADEASCKDKAWRFTDASLSTPAGSRCSFSKVTPVPGGYDIAARCTAEGPETDDTIELRFAESARAMLFESDSIADAGLVYCGDEA